MPCPTRKPLWNRKWFLLTIYLLLIVLIGWKTDYFEWLRGLLWINIHSGAILLFVFVAPLVTLIGLWKKMINPDHDDNQDSDNTYHLPHELPLGDSAKP